MFRCHSARNALILKGFALALFEAKEEAQEIIKYRNKLEVLDIKLALLEEIIEQLKQQRDEAIASLYTTWYAAVYTMDEGQLGE